MKLTALEKLALVDLWDSSYGNGHDFGFPDELPNVPKASRGGVVSSLAKKNLIEVVDNSCDGYPNQFVFLDGGRELFADFKYSPELKGS